MSAIPPGMSSEASPESAAWDGRVRYKKGIIDENMPLKYCSSGCPSNTGCAMSRIANVRLWGGAIKTLDWGAVYTAWYS